MRSISDAIVARLGINAWDLMFGIAPLGFILLLGTINGSSRRLASAEAGNLSEKAFGTGMHAVISNNTSGTSGSDDDSHSSFDEMNARINALLEENPNGIGHS